MTDRRARARVVVLALLLVGACIAILVWQLGSGDETAGSADETTGADERAREARRHGGGDSTPRDEPRHAPPRAFGPVRLTPATARRDPSAGAGTLVGRVLSWGSGAPIANAELSFAREGRTAAVTSDGDGRFELCATEPGVHTLALATADGFFPWAPSFGTSPIEFRAVPGTVVEGVTVYLVPQHAYEGLVQNARGEPVAGAEVGPIGSFGHDQMLVPTDDRWVSDAEGRFAFTAPDGTVLEARHATHGRGRAVVGLGVQASGRLVIRLGALDSSFGADRAIRGRVLDPDGQPVPDALVRADREGLPAARDRELHPWIVATSGPDGSFELAGLDTGSYALVADAEGYGTAEVSGVPAGSERVELRLADEALLEGSVVDAAGAPVPAATIIVERMLGPLERDVAAVTSALGSDGRFTVRGLSADDYIVRAHAHGHAPSDEISVSLAERGTRDVVLTLRRGATIAGRVTSGERGRGIAEARVSIEGTSGDGPSAVPLHTSALTDREGRFEIAGVAPGVRSLFAAASDHHARVISGIAVAEGARVEVAIDLTPTEDGEEPRIELAGIGAVLSAEGDALVIGDVVEGGGAAEVGLAPGDAILAVGGIPVTELGFGGAIEAIRGPEGSTVQLSVRRAGGDRVETLAVPRRRIRA